MGGENVCLGGRAGGDGLWGGDGTLWGVWPSSGGWVDNYGTLYQNPGSNITPSSYELWRLKYSGSNITPEPKYYQTYVHCIKILGVTLHQVLMKYEDLNIVGVTLPQNLNMIRTIYTIKPLEQHYTRFLIYEVLTHCLYYMMWIPCDMYFLSVPNILTLWPWPWILTYFKKKT